MTENQDVRRLGSKGASQEALYLAMDVGRSSDLRMDGIDAM